MLINTAVGNKMLALDLQHCKFPAVGPSALEGVPDRCGIYDEHYRLYTDAAASQLSPPVCPAPQPRLPGICR